MFSNSLYKVEDTERGCSSGRQLQSQHLGSTIITSGFTSSESHQRKSRITACSEPQTPPPVFETAPCLSGLQIVTSGSFSYTLFSLREEKEKERQ